MDVDLERQERAVVVMVVVASADEEVDDADGVVVALRIYHAERQHEDHQPLLRVILHRS